MQPTKKHLAVASFVAPEIFDRFRQIGKEMGFKKVFSGPLVRSSYHAAEQALN
jgi:lipoic acid synthetase